MAKISAEDRETAALICAIAASTPDLNDYYSAVVRELEIPHDDGAAVNLALNLALNAWGKAHRFDYGGPRDAEAEALIRSGWSPS